MAQGYTRNDTANNIATNNIINASDLDGEFDAIQSAFVATTGHTHDGTLGGGAPVSTLGPTQEIVVTATAIRPSADNTIDLGTNLLEFKDLYIDGTANIDSLVADTADINGGTIDNATIATSNITVGAGKTLDVSAGTLTLADNQISGDKVEGGTIAATTITTLTSTTVNATTVDTTNLEVTTLKAKDGTTAGTVANATGVVTLSSLVAPTADINGGTVDGTVIGASVPAAITGTTITGTSFVTTGDMTFGDNDKAIFGAGSDLQIYHNGSNSFIEDVAGTGSLYIRSNQTVFTNPSGTENVAVFNEDADVRLFYNGAIKLATTATGIAVTGDATFADNGKAIFGAGSDLQIYHDASLGQSRIQDVGTGSLYLQGDGGVVITNSAGTSTSATFASTGATSLSYNGTTKFATTGTGIDVTGTVTADGLTVDGSLGDIRLGPSYSRVADADNGGGWAGGYNAYVDVSTVKHDSTGPLSAIYYNGTGVNVLTDESAAAGTTAKRRALFASNGDISFYEDTGITPKFFWDASAESLGIGNAAPTSALEVTGTVYATSAGGVAFKMNSGSAIRSNTTSATHYMDLGTVNFRRGDGANTQAQVNVYGGGYFAGSVGIGTSSPVAPLHVIDKSLVTGTAPQIRFNANANDASDADRLMLGLATASGQFVGGSVAGDGILRTTDGGNLIFGEGTTERMRITSAGNVGVGTASPSTELDVAGTVTATAFAGPLTGAVTGNASTATTLTGLTSTIAELNYTDGVTSAIQTQLNAKAPLASPALTGTPTAPTAAVGTNTTQVATTAFVNAEIANDAPTKTGTGASGTWGIDISGNAATATSATSAATATTLTGLTSTIAELNYTAGVTSAIQTQLNAKAPSAAPTLSGTITITGGTQSWTVIASGTNLTFAYNGNNKMRLDNSGNLTVVGNVTAYGTL